MSQQTLTVSAKYDDGQKTEEFSVAGRESSVANKAPQKLTQSIGTSLTALNLGGAAAAVCTLHVKNLDPTNFVRIYNETGGKEIARLDPDTDSDGNGGFIAFSRTAADLLTPYGKADTAACLVEIYACPL